MRIGGQQNISFVVLTGSPLVRFPGEANELVANIDQLSDFVDECRTLINHFHKDCWFVFLKRCCHAAKREFFNALDIKLDQVDLLNAFFRKKRVDAHSGYVNRFGVG